MTKNLDRIYIISWFGNSDVREKRVEYHNRQVDWAIGQGLDVFVLPQYYNQEEFRSDVTYINCVYPEGIELFLPGEARNILLKHFYASDSNFAIFADNDAVLYDGDQHCDSRDFAAKFNAIPLKSLEHVDLFVPLNPRKMPFSKTIEDNQSLFDDNFVFHRNPDAKGSFLVVKNIKKSYDTEIYYDEAFKTPERKLIPLEDVDFGLNFMYHGYSSYMLHNIILKEYASLCSTWTATDDRVGEFPKGREIICKKYSLSMNDKGHIIYKQMYNRSKGQPKLYVKKSTAVKSILDDF